LGLSPLRLGETMDPKKLDIVLKFKGSTVNGGMKITGRDNIVDWMAECKTILEALDRITSEHNLDIFFGVRCEFDFADFRNELARAFQACKNV
jgi:hypothetical protein